ncbi:MAG: nitrile hydratase subunit beta [Pseudomonadota bacterium]
MNGPQDLGGRHGHGPISPDPNEPLFHAPWESRSLAMTVAMGATGLWNIDQSRATRESLPARDYIRFPYYRIWFEAVCRMVEEHGLADADEVATGEPQSPSKPIPRLLKADAVKGVLMAGTPANRETATEPTFKVGDRVLTKIQNPKSHTRLPHYASGRPGTITMVHGHHVYPDVSSTGAKGAEWLYCVEFEAADLWGADTTASSVSLDLWEPYLERG